MAAVLLPYIAFASLAAISYWQRKLSLSGALAGLLVASITFFYASWQGICYVGVFFLVGTIATSIRNQHTKDTTQHPPRAAANVLANTSGIFLACITASTGVFTDIQAGIAFSQAVALSDTLSSELGSVWGKRHWLVSNGRAVPAGTDGAVSLAGILAGFAGSLLIGLCYGTWQADANTSNVVQILVIGMLGNYTDSLLGAYFQNRPQPILSNHGVNAWSNLMATGLGMLLWSAL